MDQKEQIVTEKLVRNKTLLAFLFFFLFIAACLTGWIWLINQPKEDGALKPLRTVLNTNESIFTYFFSGRHLSKMYPKNLAMTRPRVNGSIGLKSSFDPANWKLAVVRYPGDTIFISLNEIRSLPKTEIIFDFKCIEGWSQVTHWSGVRFSDFAKKYGLTEQMKLQYTGMSTPDHAYYIGIDNASMLHPQTMLCYEMNGAPLPMNQGYPLRLIIPVKYGIKHLKRIGSIYFSNQRPPDYWYEQGYDYYSGL